MNAVYDVTNYPKPLKGALTRSAKLNEFSIIKEI